MERYYWFWESTFENSDKGISMGKVREKEKEDRERSERILNEWFSLFDDLLC